jgi:hypothetical protein
MISSISVESCGWYGAGGGIAGLTPKDSNTPRGLRWQAPRKMVASSLATLYPRPWTGAAIT